MRERLATWQEKAIFLALSPWRLYKVVAFVVGTVVILATGAAALAGWGFYRSLPDLQRAPFERLQERARLRVRDKLEDPGKLYKWVPIQDVSRDAIFAIVMSEDASFFEHDGVNWDAVANSLAVNIRKRTYAYGASTLSQQVVKNLYLSNEKSLFRKLKEVLITTRLEDHFTKNEILELYLNIAEFGPDVFGIRAAAKVFFGKAPGELDAAEGALLALMLPSPRRHFYSVVENRHLAPDKRRRYERVLRDLLHLDYISPAQFRAYLRRDFFNGKGALARPDAPSKPRAPKRGSRKPR
ncbi:MAG: transglycosylase domain-containing protein [Bdellovibrionales bacterium]|nr:transglycosylase domain-containing protein [Bdellovibrionales bacterium]